MPAYPALPIFIDAWALDCSHLSDAEDGRYFRLCRLLWSMPECRIPNDDIWIARKLNRPVGDVQQLVRPIITEFFQTDENWITQKRLLKEWHYVRRKSRQNTVAAKIRWRNEKEASERNAGTHSECNAPTPTPTPTPIEEPLAKANGSSNAKGSGHARRRTKEHEPAGFAAWYAAYPRHVGRPPAARAYRAALEKSDEQTLLAGAERAAIDYAGTDPQFIPHPATWLNREGWLDEHPAGNGGGNRGGRPGIVAGTRLFLAALERSQSGGE